MSLKRLWTAPRTAGSPHPCICSLETISQAECAMLCPSLKNCPDFLRDSHDTNVSLCISRLTTDIRLQDGANLRKYFKCRAIPRFLVDFKRLVTRCRSHLRPAHRPRHQGLLPRGCRHPPSLHLLLCRQRTDSPSACHRPGSSQAETAPHRPRHRRR